MTENIRNVPINAIDAQMQQVNPAWGQMHEIPQEMRNHLANYEYLKDEDGNKVTDESGRPVVVDKNLWGRLSIYTRDLRMGNISKNWGEPEYVEHYVDLANDLINEGFKEPGIISLSRGITKLEISQSRNGFFRKNENTIRQETTSRDEPPKRTLFGGGKPNGNN